MTININEYRNIYPLIKKRLKDNPNVNIDEYATDLAIETFVPIIVIYYFLMEILGENKQLLEKIAGLIKFYGYNKICGYRPKGDRG